MEDKLKIAIIGAGISGLSAAYQLKKQGHSVTIIEKDAHVGGNAKTVEAQIGKHIMPVDMGTNDFNSNTFTNLVEVFKELNIDYKPIDPGITLFTTDGSVQYVRGCQWRDGSCAALRKEIDRFKRVFCKVLLDPEEAYTTMGDYLMRYQYSDDFIENFLLPTMRGLFIFDVDAPMEMPVRGVAHFLTLQHGYQIGSLPIQSRMTFVGGIENWIERLISVIDARVRTNQDITLSANKDGVIVHYSENDEYFDKVIVTCPTHAISDLFRCGLPDEMEKLLAPLKYHTITGYLHTYNRLLPPDNKAWSSYCIHIPRDDEHRGFTMNFVVNQHQNHYAFPEIYPRDLPKFFITYNPIKEIPPCCILKTPHGEPIIRSWKHLILNMDAIKLHDGMHAQQGINNIYYAGSYVGSSNHIDCWLTGETAAKLVEKPDYHTPYTYDPDATGKEYPPLYIYNALKEKSDEFFVGSAKRG